MPQEELETALAGYPNCQTLVWCQEEPRNQGSWHRIQNHLSRALHKGQRLEHVSRDASASPAVGYYQKHLEEQETLVNEALGSPSASLAATAAGS
jgi:2-oxoglutarate dehydrogenase E1 component